MEITINRSATQEQSLVKLVWKQSMVKYFLFNIIILFCGLLLLFMKVEINSVEAPFWNFGSAIGLGFILIGILRLVTLIKSHFSIQILLLNLVRSY